MKENTKSSAIGLATLLVLAACGGSSPGPSTANAPIATPTPPPPPVPSVAATPRGAAVGLSRFDDCDEVLEVLREQTAAAIVSQAQALLKSYGVERFFAEMKSDGFWDDKWNLQNYIRK